MNQYAYQYIPSGIKKLYQDISVAIKNGSNIVHVPHMQDIQEVLYVLSRCLLDNPDIFWLQLGVSMKSSLLGKTVHILDIEVSQGRIQQMKNELEMKVRSILSMNELLSCRTDSEKLKFIYKYIRENTEYDFNEVNSHSNPLAHTAYGAIVNGLSVCTGNTKAVMLLCQRLGIACMGVDGELNGGAHSWLMVRSDGIWYNMDPTVQYMLNGLPDFSHWLESDNEISSNHKWNRNDYPVCNTKNSEAHKEHFSAVRQSSASVFPKKQVVSRQKNLYPDALHVDSLSEYQRILHKNLKSSKGELKMVFGMGFGPVRHEMLIKLLEKIALECIQSEISYSWDFDKSNRYFEVKWE